MLFLIVVVIVVMSLGLVLVLLGGMKLMFVCEGLIWMSFGKSFGGGVITFMVMFDVGLFVWRTLYAFGFLLLLDVLLLLLRFDFEFFLLLLLLLDLTLLFDGVDSFGVSAKASDVLKALKFTVNDLKDYYKNLK
jgi:hypothetical protein